MIEMDSNQTVMDEDDEKVIFALIMVALIVAGFWALISLSYIADPYTDSCRFVCVAVDATGIAGGAMILSGMFVGFYVAYLSGGDDDGSVEYVDHGDTYEGD